MEKRLAKTVGEEYNCDSKIIFRVVVIFLSLIPIKNKEKRRKCLSNKSPQGG